MILMFYVVVNNFVNIKSTKLGMILVFNMLKILLALPHMTLQYRI